MKTPTEKEVKDQMYAAIESGVNAKGTAYPDMSYEQGVRAALAWVLGEDDDEPIDLTTLKH